MTWSVELVLVTPFASSLGVGKVSRSRMHFYPQIWEDPFQHEHGLVTACGRKHSSFRHHHRTSQKLWLCSASCKIWSNKIDYSYLLERQIKAICMFFIILQWMHTHTLGYTPLCSSPNVDFLQKKNSEGRQCNICMWRHQAT